METRGPAAKLVGSQVWSNKQSQVETSRASMVSLYTWCCVESKDTTSPSCYYDHVPPLHGLTQLPSAAAGPPSSERPSLSGRSILLAHVFPPCFTRSVFFISPEHNGLPWKRGWTGWPSPSCQLTPSVFQRRWGSREREGEFCCRDTREVLLTKLLFKLLFSLRSPHRKASAEAASRTSIEYETTTEERISRSHLNWPLVPVQSPSAAASVSPSRA